MKKIFWWIIFLLLFIWQLPQNIIAILMIPFLGKLKLSCKRNYCFCFVGSKMAGGISLGNFAFIDEKNAKNPADIAHEVIGHTKQSKIFGPFYLNVIGIPSMANAIFDFTKCYYDFYTEKWANKIAHVKVMQVTRQNKVYNILMFEDGYSL